MRFFPLAARGAALALALVALASCGNNSGTGPFGSGLFMRFRANGTQVEYVQQGGLTSVFNTSGGQYKLTLTGSEGAVSFVVLTVWDVTTITEKTYEGLTGAAGSVVGATVAYRNPAGVSYESGTSTAEATIVITEISGTNVGGTFSGVLHASGQPDLTVTEGSFRVARLN